MGGDKQNSSLDVENQGDRDIDQGNEMDAPQYYPPNSKQSCEILKRADKKLFDINKQLPRDGKLQMRFAIHENTLYHRGSMEEHYRLCIPKNLTTQFCQATTVSSRLEKAYFPLNGVPKRLLSDHGTQFNNDRWKATLAAHGAQAVYLSVRHPNSNPSERVMREIGRLCKTYLLGATYPLAYRAPQVLAFLNNLTHETTEFSPVEL
ncbi:hypothetical protein JTB14_025948 [Gonioctena quinquepunctata]|nr:hypothetical protein JTB14_025948 [Gonioctena quinquepunctata]